MPLGWILMAFSCPGGKPSCVTLVTPKMAPYWVSVDRSSATPGMGSVTAPERARDSVELAKLAFGAEAIDPASGKLRTMLISLINVNSPMVYDATMLGALPSASQIARHE